MKADNKNLVETGALVVTANLGVWTAEKFSLYVQIALGIISIIWVGFQLFRGWEERKEKRKKEKAP